MCCGHEGLHAVSLLDGSTVAHAQVSRELKLAYAAADAESGHVFASTFRAPFAVHAWSWLPSADGRGIAARGSILYLGPIASAATAKSTRMRPLAVMPPSAGKRTAHLIVGTCLGKANTDLLVLSLPGFALVHEHRLEGMQVCGLATDPLGQRPCCQRLIILLHARSGLAAAWHAAAESSSGHTLLWVWAVSKL